MTKPLTLTSKHRAILAVLQEFPCLSLPFIGELTGHKARVSTPTEGNPVVRYHYLRRFLIPTLRAEGYIELVDAVRPHVGQKNRHNVYALTAKARKLIPADPHRMRRTNNPHHDLGACFVAASFKLGVMADPRLTYITPEQFLEAPYCPVSYKDEAPFSIPVRYWHGKYVDTSRRHDWRPFGIAFGGKKILFAGIEYDRDQEGKASDDPERSSIERHLRTILALLETGYKEHFGTAKLFVPVVTTGPIERWTSTLMDLTDDKGAERILFRHMPDWNVSEVFPEANGHMLTGPWQRAGYPPLDLLELLGAKEKAATEIAA